MKTVAIFDLDLTISNCDTFVAFLLHVLSTSPLRCLRAAWLPAALALYYGGLRDNTWLKKTFLGTIAGGARREKVETWAHDFVEQLHKSGLRPSALRALEQHRAQGHSLVLATASFDFYVAPLAASLGFDTLICTKSAWHKDRLCGAIDGQNCYGQHKYERIVEFLAQDPEPCHTIAYSDHHSDLPLLLWAREAYAVNPSRKLETLAVQHGIPVLDWNS